jgi:hypothetical protein
MKDSYYINDLFPAETMSAPFPHSIALAALALVVASAALTAQTTSDTKPKQKTVTSICKDGTTSTASGSGACAGHKGVDSLATKAAKDADKAAKAEAKVEKAKKSNDPQKVAKADAKAKSAEAKADKAEDKAAKDATGATAQCKDGTYSHAKSTQGACSRHGGVAKSLKP